MGEGAKCDRRRTEEGYDMRECKLGKRNSLRKMWPPLYSDINRMGRRR
jgi:hypothetical protein